MIKSGASSWANQVKHEVNKTNNSPVFHYH